MNHFSLFIIVAFLIALFLIICLVLFTKGAQDIPTKATCIEYIINEKNKLSAKTDFHINNRPFTSSYIYLYRGEFLFKIIFSLFSAIKPVVIPKEKKADLFSGKQRFTTESASCLQLGKFETF